MSSQTQTSSDLTHINSIDMEPSRTAQYIAPAKDTEPSRCVNYGTTSEHAPAPALAPAPAPTPAPAETNTSLNVLDHYASEEAMWRLQDELWELAAQTPQTQRTPLMRTSYAWTGPTVEQIQLTQYLSNKLPRCPALRKDD